MMAEGYFGNDNFLADPVSNTPFGPSGMPFKFDINSMARGDRSEQIQQQQTQERPQLTGEQFQAEQRRKHEKADWTKYESENRTQLTGEEGQGQRVNPLFEQWRQQYKPPEQPFQEPQQRGLSTQPFQELQQSGLSTVINPNQQNTAPPPTTGGLFGPSGMPFKFDINSMARGDREVSGGLPPTSTPTTSGLSTVINPNQQNTAPPSTTGGLSSVINPNQQNPVATPPINPTPTTGPFIPTPVAGTTTAGATTVNQGNNMALPSIFNPQVNPNVTQTQTAQTTAPDWYSNFLSGLNTSGQAAVNQGGIAPASTLQTMAYNTAPTAIGAGAPALAQATAAAGNVAATPTTSLIGDYMNPYTQSVVKSIGDLGTQQFREFTDPAMTSYGVATGQFGGSRAQDIRAKAARDAAMNITAQQTQAMNTGFNNALTAAQNQQNLGLNTANVLGNLSSQAQSQGIVGLNALSTLGAQQQTLSQAERNYPMTALQNYANLIGGLNVPTGTSQTVTGPAGGGQMSQSVLNQILGMGTSGMALLNQKTPDGKSTIGQSILDYFRNSNANPTAGETGPGFDEPVLTYNPDGSPIYTGPGIDENPIFTETDNPVPNFEDLP